jgi:hypothetical protein
MMKSVLLLLTVISFSALPAPGQLDRSGIVLLNTPPYALEVRSPDSGQAQSTRGIARASHNSLFVDAPEFATGYRSLSVAVGDFNGDGNPDLAVANYCGKDPTCGSDGTVSILLGNGDGTFRKVADYATQGGSSAVVIADFNGDGKLDLAVVNRCNSARCNDYSTQGTVSILLRIPVLLTFSLCNLWIQKAGKSCCLVVLLGRVAHRRPLAFNIERNWSSPSASNARFGMITNDRGEYMSKNSAFSSCAF